MNLIVNVACPMRTLFHDFPVLVLCRGSKSLWSDFLLEQAAGEKTDCFHLDTGEDNTHGQERPGLSFDYGAWEKRRTGSPRMTQGCKLVLRSAFPVWVVLYVMTVFPLLPQRARLVSWGVAKIRDIIRQRLFFLIGSPVALPCRWCFSFGVVPAEH